MTKRKNISNKLFEPGLVKKALWKSIVKLNPITMFHNPIMFCVLISAIVMTGVCFWIVIDHTNAAQGRLGYNIIVTLILFITLIFANFAEAVAEARGKAQADSLRKTREEILLAGVSSLVLRNESA